MDRAAVDDTEENVRQFLSELSPIHQALAKAQISLVRKAIRVADDKGNIGTFIAGTMLSMTKVLVRLAAEEAETVEKTGKPPATMSNLQSALMTTLVFALAMCDEFPSTPAPEQQAN